MPSLYIIAGPNGAGKTTFAREWLATRIDWEDFLNADIIAAEMSPDSPESVAIPAGRLMLERLYDRADRKVDFAVETTLAGLSYVKIIKRLSARGHKAHLAFLWVREVDFSIARVAKRVSEGGHNIPQDVIRRRFNLGIRHLFKTYRPLLTSWQLYDNADELRILIAEEVDGELTIYEQSRYEEILAMIEEDNDVVH
jgi:predicted ABC-type ATPase